MGEKEERKYRKGDPSCKAQYKGFFIFKRVELLEVKFYKKRAKRTSVIN